MDVRTQGKTTTPRRPRLDRAQIDPRALFSAPSKNSESCQLHVTMAERTPVPPPQRKRGVQTPRQERKAKQPRESPMIERREGAEDASVSGDLAKNATQGTKMKSGQGRAQEQKIQGVDIVSKKEFRFDPKGQEFNYSNDGTDQIRWVYPGFGGFFSRDEVGVVEDFRTFDQGKVNVLTKRVLGDILRRPRKFCVRLRENGFSSDAYKKCMCFDDHKRCLKWTLKDSIDATGQHDNYPPVVYSYYEKPVRLMLGIRFVTEKRWTMDDVFRYMLEHAIIMGSGAQNKHSGILLTFPFATSKGTMNAFQGLTWCPQMMYEFTGNKIPTAMPRNTLMGPLQFVPEEHIRKNRKAAYTKSMAIYCIGGSAAVDACIFQGQWGDTSLEKYLSDNGYLRRHAYGRSLLVNFPGKTLETQRNLFLRYNVSQVRSRQLVMFAYCCTKAKQGLSEMWEHPTDRDVWEMFYGQFGNTLTKSQFETLLDQVSNSLSQPPVFYDKDIKEYYNLGKANRKQQLFYIGYHGMCYDHTPEVLDDKGYEGCRYYVRVPHTRRRVDNEHRDYQYNTENYAAEAEDSPLYESLESPFEYKKKRDTTMSDEALGQASAKLSSQYANEKKALIQHCKQSSSGSDPMLLATDSFRALPCYAPGLEVPEVYKEKPQPQAGFLIRRGLKHVMLPLKGKQFWKSGSIDLQHDEDCLMHKVPKCLLDVLERVYVAVKDCTGCTVKSSIGSTSLPMKRLNGNDNLLVSRESKSLSDLLVTLKVMTNADADTLERAFNEDVRQLLKFNGGVCNRCWIQKTVPDITKNTVEAMRLEYPCKTIENMRKDGEKVLVCMIPLTQHGHTRLLFPGPFECTNGEALNVPADEGALKALAGVVCHTLFGTMSVQPTSLLHADGLLTCSSMEPFLCMNICASTFGDNENENVFQLRANPHCYFGISGPIQPTEEEMDHITKVAILAQATTNSLTKDKVLPTVKSITPTKHGGREKEHKYQGGNYLRARFGPLFAYGYSENWTEASAEENNDGEQLDLDDIPEALLVNTVCTHERADTAAQTKTGRKPIYKMLDCVELDEDYQVNTTPPTEGTIATQYNIGFDTADSEEENAEE